MGIKFIDLNQAPGLQSADIFPISQDIGGSRDTKKVTIQQLITYLNHIPKPSVAYDGQVLTYDYTTSTWVASAGGAGDFIPKPESPTDKQVLTYDNTTNKWVANNLKDIGSGDFIPKPISASDKQVLTYDGTTSTWAASGLSNIGFECSANTNGYQKLPSGLIMQWGVYLDKASPNTATANTFYKIEFPIQFPNKCFNVSITNYDDSNPSNAAAILSDTPTVSSVNIAWNTTASHAVFWQAIGN